MNTIENENVILVDVDGTLLFWTEPLVPGPGKIECNYGGRPVYLTPNLYLVDLIKTYKKRGCFIIVASANGYAWAENAVKVLGLSEHVDLKMSKFHKYIDDCHIDGWAKQLIIPDIYADTTAS